MKSPFFSSTNFRYSVYLPQRILLDFPSLNSLAFLKKKKRMKKKISKHTDIFLCSKKRPNFCGLDNLTMCFMMLEHV